MRYRYQVVNTVWQPVKRLSNEHPCSLERWDFGLRFLWLLPLTAVDALRLLTPLSAFGPSGTFRFVMALSGADPKVM
jgi:hypothetical protein